MLPDTYIWMKEDLKTTIDRQERKLARNYLLICSFLSLIHVIGEWHPNPWLQYGGTTLCAKRRPKWGWAVNYWMEISAAASFLIYRAGQETASCARRELINRPRFRPFSKHICPRNPFSIHQFFDGDLQFQMAFSFAKVSWGSQEVIHQFLPATLSDVLCALFPLQICGPDWQVSGDSTTFARRETLWWMVTYFWATLLYTLDLGMGASLF